MKKIQLLMAMMVMALCTGICPELHAQETISMQSFKFDKKSSHGSVKLEGAVPTATSEASTAIRNTLLEDIDRAVATCGSEHRRYAPYNGSTDDVQALADYIGNHLCKSRVTIEFTLQLNKQTDRYLIFSEQTYYDGGGVHPGTTVVSRLFRASDGKCIHHLFRKGADKDMQSIIRRGLLSYFKSCGEDVTDANLNDQLTLPDSNSLIPLPAGTPTPSADGLVFTYAQEEIACYAAGMPTFTVSYQDLQPYLTDDAKALFE